MNTDLTANNTRMPEQSLIHVLNNTTQNFSTKLGGHFKQQNQQKHKNARKFGTK